MAADRRELKIAIVGLGRVGTAFFNKFIERKNGIKIVAAVEMNDKAIGITVARSKGIPIYKTSRELVSSSENVDIIFDLTGNADTRRTLRSELARSGNQHSVIAPEVIAYMIWDLMGETADFPGDHQEKGY